MASTLTKKAADNLLIEMLENKKEFKSRNITNNDATFNNLSVTGNNNSALLQNVQLR